MLIYIDIDDTICYRETKDLDYSDAIPIAAAIDGVNQLYAAGHTIVFWTARGTMTGIDWRSVTESQLKAWGVNYHELKFGKPAYDLFIDDKNMNAIDWLNSLTNKS